MTGVATRIVTPGRAAAAALLALACAFPLATTNPYTLSVMSLAYIAALSATGLNLIAGYAGQLNLAHAGFMAVGAYTVGILTVDHDVPFWIALVAAGLVASALGGVVGLVSLRLRGQVFAIFTLCVGIIIALVIEKWDGLTHGVDGLVNIPQPPLPLPAAVAGGAVAQYYLVLAFLIGGLAAMQRIVASLLGRAFVAIRNGEALAQALGVAPMHTKLTAFMLSTLYAGLAGGLYAGTVRFLGPDLAAETQTFDAITAVVIGGLGTLLGPVVGSLAVAWLLQELQALQSYRMVVFGPLLILLIMFFPRGIVGSLEGAWQRRASRRPTGGTAPDGGVAAPPGSEAPPQGRLDIPRPQPSRPHA